MGFKQNLKRLQVISIHIYTKILLQQQSITKIFELDCSTARILYYKLEENVTYNVLGHNSFRKLVCINPGSRHPTVIAGSPEHINMITPITHL